MKMITIASSLLITALSASALATSTAAAPSRIYGSSAQSIHQALQGKDSAGQLSGHISCQWSTEYQQGDENQKPEALRTVTCAAETGATPAAIRNSAEVADSLLKAGVVAQGDLSSGSLEADITCDRHIEHQMADIGVEGDILDYTICTIQ